MKLTSCPSCERHVATDASSCPFCGVKLGTTSGVARVAMVAAVGLTMASCVVGDNGGSDYAGPGTTGEPQDTSTESADTAGSETGGTGGESTSSAGSSGEGDSTSSGPGDSGGQDYAGAAPDPKDRVRPHD